MNSKEDDYLCSTCGMGYYTDLSDHAVCDHCNSRREHARVTWKDSRARAFAIGYLWGTAGTILAAATYFFIRYLFR